MALPNDVAIALTLIQPPLVVALVLVFPLRSWALSLASVLLGLAWSASRYVGEVLVRHGAVNAARGLVW